MSGNSLPIVGEYTFGRLWLYCLFALQKVIPVSKYRYKQSASMSYPKIH